MEEREKEFVEKLIQNTEKWVEKRLEETGDEGGSYIYKVAFECLIDDIREYLK